MFKNLFAASSVVASMLSFGMNIDVERGGLMLDYHVISDEYSDGLKEGTFELRGTVINRTTGLPEANAIVTNEKETFQAFTDSAGYFELALPMKERKVYCYKNGLTEVVFDNYDFKNKHLIEVEFFLRDPEEIIIVTKPVIYLYNAESTVKINLLPHDNLTFTYPQLNEEWNVSTTTDGKVYDEGSGKEYPYLFWEAESRKLDFITDKGKFMGYLIKTDTCVNFMEGVLEQFGLNQRETTDFITFWGPKMIEKDYALVQFLVDDDYSDYIARIKAEPAPESVKRIYMLMTPLDNPETPFEVIKPEIKAFDRKGFTLIEWGGSVLNKSYNQKI